MRIAQEEIFGPVLVVIPFDSEEEAIRIANDTIYGLAGAVWTKDVTRAMRVIKAMRAGITWVNTYHPTYSEAPWGGYKQSGIGRELGSYGLDEYTEIKQINIDLTDQPMGVYQRGKPGGGRRSSSGGNGGRGNGRKVVPLSDRRPVPRGRDGQGRGLGAVLRELRALRGARPGGAAADRAPGPRAGARAAAPPLEGTAGPAGGAPPSAAREPAGPAG